MSTETKEDLAEWRANIEARISALEAAVFGRAARVRDQLAEDMGGLKFQFLEQECLLKALSEMLSGQAVRFRDHSATLTDLRVGQVQFRQDVTEIRVGIRTIIDLLGQGGGAAGPSAGARTGERSA